MPGLSLIRVEGNLPCALPSLPGCPVISSCFPGKATEAETLTCSRSHSQLTGRSQPSTCWASDPVHPLLGFVLVFLGGKDAGLIEASSTSLFLLTGSDGWGGEGRKKGLEWVAGEMKADVVTYRLSKQRPQPQRTLTSTVAAGNLTASP